MKTSLLRNFKLFFLFVACFSIQNISFGQTPPTLGATSGFALFTAAGAFDNTGASMITGDIGSNTYTPTGFPVPGTVNGNIYNASDPISALAATDVLVAFGYLSTLGGTVLGVTIVDNQVITPGVWSTGAATTLNGTVVLDGQGNANSVFIIRIGGAFATSVASNVVLTNSASLCNVFWQVNGQFNLGNNSVFRGTVVASGAINLSEGSSILGRGLSTAGGIFLHNNVVTNPLLSAVGTITGQAAVCLYQTGVIYSVPLVNNATGYIWTLPSGATITSGANTNSITVNFSATAVSGNITVQGSNSCSNGTVSSNFAVSVNSAPVAASTITGTSTVCQGQSSVVYTVPVISNATGYIWTLPAGATITAGLNTNSITVNYSTTAVSGNLTVQGNSLCGAGTVSANYLITVNPLPTAAAAITGTASICIPQTGVIYSVPVITNATDYIWTLPAGATIISGINTNNITVNYSTTAVSGNITVKGNNSCGTGTVSSNFAVTINAIPALAGIITGNDTVCQGQTAVIYTVPLIAYATSYIWTLPSGTSIIAGANTNSITVNYSSIAVSGYITVQGSSICGNGTISANYAVNVNLIPVSSGTITGISTVCQSQTGVVYSVPVITNATDYIWTLPAGASITAGANTNSITVNYSTTAVSGNITVKGNNYCGNGTISANYAVTVNPLPSASSVITGTALVCIGQTSIIYSIPVISNATDYIWTLPVGATIVAGANTNSITVSFGLTAVSGNISVQGNNSCGTGTVSANYAVTVNAVPVTAGVITGTTPVCQGLTGVNYTVPAITNATSYIWTLPAGATITAGANTNSITVSFSSTAINGNITVQGSSFCGNGIVSANYAVSVNPLPLAASVITGTDTVCQGQTGVIYSVPVITNATGYTWTLPTGATITSGAATNSITVSFSTTAVNGNISVQGNNTCGTGTVSSNYAVILNPLPSATGIISGTDTVCNGQMGVIYSVPLVTNATGYIWTLPVGATITAGGTTNSITVSFGSTAVNGNITVKGSNNCGSGTVSSNYAVIINTVPLAAGIITGISTVCQGQTGVIYSLPAISNTTGYIWTLPAGATITAGATTNNITVSYSTTAISGNITVQGINVCGTGIVSANYIVTISPLPAAAATISGIASICRPQTGVVYSIPVINDATGYIWTLPAGATITAGANTNSVTVDFSATSVSGNVTVKGSNICGSGTVSANYAVTVLSLPVAAGIITGNTSVCQGQTGVIYSVPVITNATGYIWSLPLGASISAGANTNSITVNYNTSAVSGNISVQGSNICGAGTISLNYAVTVNLLPSIPGNISGIAVVCQTLTGVIYTVPVINNATGYLWTLPAGATITAGATTNSITVSFSSIAVSGNISVQGTNSCGNGISSSMYAVIVNPLLISADTLCLGQTGVIYTVPLINYATDYIWTLPAGATITAGANTNSITVDFSTTAVSGYITVQGSNYCGTGAISANFAVTFISLPVSAGAISGSATVCHGQTGVIYTVPLINNALGYIWTIPAGATITAGANTNSITLNYNTTATSGNITVRGYNNCAIGAVSANYAVTVNSFIGSAGIISGLISVCQGQTSVVYTVPVIANATSYIWTLPAGATGTSSTNTISVNYSSLALSGNITVKGNNFCGDGIASVLSITVTPLPTAVILYAGSPFCKSVITSQAVTFTGTTGGIFTSLPTGLIINASTGAITPGTSTAGIYTVTYTVAAIGGCSVFTTTTSVTITTAPVAVISYTGTPYCKSITTAQTVTQTGSTGGIYSAIPAGLTINASTGSITPGTSTAGIYTITYTIAATGGCAVVTATNSVTITSAPTATIAYTGSPFCKTVATAQAVTLSGTIGGIYTALPSGLNINASTGAVTPGTSTAGTYTVTYTIAAAGGCAVVSATTPVTITASPTASITYSGSQFCKTLTTLQSVTQTGTNGGTYTALPAGLTINASTGAVTPVTSTAGTYTVTYTIAAASGCAVVTETAPVTINPVSIGGSLSVGTTVCEGTNSSTLTLTGYTGTVTNWKFSTDGTIWTDFANINAYYIANNLSVSTQYKAEVKSGVCTSSNSTIAIITVDPLPLNSGAIISVDNDSVSINENNVLYSVSTIVNATTYIWSYSGTGATFLGGNITTTNSVSVNFANNATSGYLTVVGHNSCGDGVVSANYPVYVSSVGISEVNNSLNFQIYPNPTKGIITIDINGIKGNMELKITNIQGKLISAEKLNTDNPSYTQDIDLSRYSKGIYFVKLISKNFTKVEKVVLK